MLASYDTIALSEEAHRILSQHFVSEQYLHFYQARLLNRSRKGVRREVL